MESYRTQPITVEERTYDGVYVDSLGAWLGKLVTANDTSGQTVTTVEPAINTTGGRIAAPVQWRDLVVERLPL